MFTGMYACNVCKYVHNIKCKLVFKNTFFHQKLKYIITSILVTSPTFWNCIFNLQRITKEHVKRAYILPQSCKLFNYIFDKCLQVGRMVHSSGLQKKINHSLNIFGILFWNEFRHFNGSPAVKCQVKLTLFRTNIYTLIPRKCH
jgi:hypothetical protein